MKIGAAVETACAGQDLGSNENMPRARAGAFLLILPCSREDCSGSTPLLIFGFLVDLVLRVGALWWVFLGNILWQGLPGSDFPVRVYPFVSEVFYRTRRGWLACSCLPSGFFSVRYS